MEKSVFNAKISTPYSYTLHEKLDIQSEKTHYPYCSLLQMMDLLSDEAVNIYNWESRFAPKVSVHMLDLARLDKDLAHVNRIDISTPDDLKLKQQIEEAKNHEFSNEDTDAFDVMREINSFQEVSFKTAPKSVILSKFLEVGNVKVEDVPGNIPHKEIDITKNHVPEGESLETETLAVVLEKQGKYDKALAIYEKLIAKNPEKSSTFAIRISELKGKIDNK